MYNRILLTLDASPTDRPIIEHVQRLAAVMHSQVVLLRVATGPAAQFHGQHAAGREIDENLAYLDQVKSEFEALGVSVTTELCCGADPVKEIVDWVETKGCDLVAMGTHGHRWLADLVLGATASRVQHSIKVPVLLLRAN